MVAVADARGAEDRSALKRVTDGMGLPSSIRRKALEKLKITSFLELLRHGGGKAASGATGEVEKFAAAVHGTGECVDADGSPMNEEAVSGCVVLMMISVETLKPEIIKLIGACSTTAAAAALKPQELVDAFVEARGGEQVSDDARCTDKLLTDVVEGLTAVRGRHLKNVNMIKDTGGWLGGQKTQKHVLGGGMFLSIGEGDDGDVAKAKGAIATHGEADVVSARLHTLLGAAGQAPRVSSAGGGPLEGNVHAGGDDRAADGTRIEAGHIAVSRSRAELSRLLLALPNGATCQAHLEAWWAQLQALTSGSGVFRMTLGEGLHEAALYMAKNPVTPRGAKRPVEGGGGGGGGRGGAGRGGGGRGGKGGKGGHSQDTEKERREKSFQAMYKHRFGVDAPGAVAPVGKGGGGAPPGAPPCGDFQRGRCGRGAGCRFSHVLAPRPPNGAAPGGPAYPPWYPPPGYPPISYQSPPPAPGGARP